MPLRSDLRRAVFAALLVIVIAGCATGPIPVAPSGGTTIAVIDRGWHTDIALPAPALSGPVAALAQDFPGVDFLVFGFGDRAYYMQREVTFLGSLAALFPGPGVILVTALRVPPVEAFGPDHVVMLALSPDQLRAISAYVQQSLAGPGGGPMQRLGDGPYPGSVFYASAEGYDVLHNCNRWTVAALRRGGLAAYPDGVIFADQVMRQARRLAGAPEG